MSAARRNLSIHDKRGKNLEKRKEKYDTGYTPTEKYKKAQLMQQFRRTGEGPGAPNTEYLNASCWDEKGRLKP